MRWSVLLSCLAAWPLAAQAPGASGDQRALLALEDQWAVALVHRDRATFEKLLGQGFVYTENDQTSDRDAVLRDIVSGPDTAVAAHNESMKVHPFGATAVVTGWLVVWGRGASGPFDRRYRFTDTWVRGKNGWQIVAAQDYVARPGP